jgi:hypothetical protein
MSGGPLASRQPDRIPSGSRPFLPTVPANVSTPVPGGRIVCSISSVSGLNSSYPQGSSIDRGLSVNCPIRRPLAFAFAFATTAAAVHPCTPLPAKEMNQLGEIAHSHRERPS